jgi:polyisoprenoid-binding protein YceI
MPPRPIDIDLTGIDSGSAEGNGALRDKDWFNTKVYPRASFVASSVRSLGGNRYEAVGKLSVKGRSRDVVAPFTFAQNGNVGVFDGQFTLKRLDYGVGEGAWADVGTVANEIQVKFHVTAGSQPAKK